MSMREKAEAIGLKLHAKFHGNGFTDEGCAYRPSCDMKRAIVHAVESVLSEVRRETWDAAIAAVPAVGVTFPEGYEEWIDSPSYRELVIAALEFAKEKDGQANQG